MGAQLANMLTSIAVAHAALAFHPDDQVEALISEAAIMQGDIQVASARSTSLELLLATLQSESDMLWRVDAELAMDALLLLVSRIEALYFLVQDQKASALTAYRHPTLACTDMHSRTPLVQACKSQSRVVFGHFRSLSEKARHLIQQFTELATDFTFQVSMAQERMEKLQNMVQAAETLREGINRQRESWQGHKEAAEIHTQQARETILSAERKLDSMESARVVRNFFTFGLGEAFDFFDLNEEIEGAERTIANAERNAHACEQSVQRAIVALQRISDENLSLCTFRDVVHAQETMLQESVLRGQALRTRTLDLTNASLDVSLFIGSLAGRSETLAMHFTAQEFARGVLNFGRLMVSEQRFNELLVQHDPGTLQETLDMIARSDSENGTEERGQPVETQRLWAAIEDMM